LILKYDNTDLSNNTYWELDWGGNGFVEI